MTRTFLAGPRAGFTGKDRQGVAAASPSTAATAIKNYRVDGVAGGAGSADCPLTDEWAWIWSRSGNVRPSSAPSTSDATSTTSPACGYELSLNFERLKHFF